MTKKQITELTSFEKYLENYNAGSKLTFADIVVSDAELAKIIDYAITHKHSVKRTYDALKQLFPGKVKSLETYKLYVKARGSELEIDDSRSKAELLEVIRELEKYSPLIDWADKKAAAKNVPVEMFIKGMLQTQA